jgi:uncharacterized protein YebE (UPF0316 family)
MKKILTNQEVLSNVIEYAEALRNDLRSGKKTIEEVRTEAVILNTMNKSVQLNIQDQIVESNLGYIQSKQARAMLSMKDED